VSTRETCVTCRTERPIDRRGMCKRCYRRALAAGDRVKPRTGKKVWLEDVEMLADAGAAWPEIERRIAARKTVEMACYRAGRHELARRITANGQRHLLAA
jgi:hypothetical protein